MSEAPHHQAEPEHISTSLDVETLDANLFRSKSLKVPVRARGVFGGQVISQALVCATRCVDPAYALNSLHCYFLLSAKSTVPIIYHVDRVRNGRSYCTRTVRACQNGQTVFVMMCSFQRPEPWQPHNHQVPMPKNVPSPEECEEPEILYQRYLKNVVKPEAREVLLEVIEERKASPLSIRHAGIRTNEEGTQTLLTWFKARNMSNYTPSFQKCILGYISDSNFIAAATKVLNIDRYKTGANRLTMTSTIDHSIWFYDSDFDCGDWLLYVVEVPRARYGRAVVTGRMYTKAGKLIAFMTQEGVVRVDVRAPEPEVPQIEKARL